MDYKSSMEKFIAETEQSIRDFEQEYPTYSYRKKVQYWLSYTHHQMRTQGEMTGDSYNGFSKRSYESNLKLEPDFDAIFKEAASGLQSFNMAEYKKRIKQ